MPTRPSRTHPTATSGLFRTLAAYLIAISLIQSLAAAFALGAGPLHVHRPAAAAVVSSPLFAHQPRVAGHAHFDLDERRANHAEMHTHAEGAAARHHHGAGDLTVVRDAADQDTAEAVASALTAALSLLALQTPRDGQDPRVHVLVPGRGWFLQVASVRSIYRPPDQN